MTTQTQDSAEMRAHDLQAALKARGIASAVHWDRSPWGVRIWLTDEDGPEYATPSVFVLTELTPAYAPNCYKWIVCFGGFDPDIDDSLQDLIMEIPERGATHATRLDSVVQTVFAFLLVLRHQVVTS